MAKKNNFYEFSKFYGIRCYIYRPDMAKIRPDLLYTPKGRPFFEDRQEIKETKDNVEELRDIIRWKKLKGKIKW